MIKITKPLQAIRMKFFIAIIFVLALAVSPTWAHNVYSSFTRIDWNHNDGSIELVFQTHSHELEAKLSLILGERLSFLEDNDYTKLEAAMRPYVQENFALQVDGQTIILDYIGMENVNQTIFVYLEANWPAKPTSIKFMNAILLEDLPGQINSVMAVVRGERKGGDITKGSGPVEFTF